MNIIIRQVLYFNYCISFSSFCFPFLPHNLVFIRPVFRTHRSMKMKTMHLKSNYIPNINLFNFHQHTIILQTGTFLKHFFETKKPEIINSKIFILEKTHFEKSSVFQQAEVEVVAHVRRYFIVMKFMTSTFRKMRCNFTHLHNMRVYLTHSRPNRGVQSD